MRSLKNNCFNKVSSLWDIAECFIFNIFSYLFSINDASWNDVLLFFEQKCYVRLALFPTESGLLLLPQ